MKLKFYLRGFGSGIIVATIIFAIANMFSGFAGANKISSNTELTTGSVLAYTKETQSVTETEQSQSTKSSEQTVTEGNTVTIATADNSATASNISGNSGAVSIQTETKNNLTTDNASTTATHETLKAGQKVSVDIKNINYMYEVGDILYEKGIISNVTDFNGYMINNGYDVKLREGTYELTAGDSYENIAKIITRS